MSSYIGINLVPHWSCHCLYSAIAAMLVDTYDYVIGGMPYHSFYILQAYNLVTLCPKCYLDYFAYSIMFFSY